MEKEEAEQRARQLMKDAGVDNHLSAKYRRLLYEKLCELRDHPALAILKSRVDVDGQLKKSAFASAVNFLKQNHMDLTIEMIKIEAGLDLKGLPKGESLDELISIDPRPFSERIEEFKKQLGVEKETKPAVPEYKRGVPLRERLGEIFPDYSSSEEDDESFY